MAEQVVNYQCPACQAPLSFKPDASKVVCEYCNNEFDVELIKKYNLEDVFVIHDKVPYKESINVMKKHSLHSLKHMVYSEKALNLTKFHKR